MRGPAARPTIQRAQSHFGHILPARACVPLLFIAAPEYYIFDMSNVMHAQPHMNATIESFFHEPSSTWTHLAFDPLTRDAALIDPVLDFDYAAGVTAPEAVQRIVAHVRASGLRLQWILETHAHADHLSAASHLREALGGRTAIGAGIRDVQAYFGRTLNFEPAFRTDGSQFDHLFVDGERFQIGSLPALVIATPGHTRDSVSYLIGDALFAGDTLFMPDVGSARCDFPGGDAGVLYDSIRKLYELPERTRLFVCHDYAPAGREHRAQSSIGEQRRSNIHARDGISRGQFIEMRRARDRTLGAPTLLYPAVQVNVRGGVPPPAESNGVAYLKVPMRTAAPRQAGDCARALDQPVPAAAIGADT